MRPNVPEKPGIVMTGYEAMSVIDIADMVARRQRAAVAVKNASYAAGWLDELRREQGSDEKGFPVASAEFEISHRASTAVLATLSVAEQIDPTGLAPGTDTLPTTARQMLVGYNSALRAQQ